MDIYKSFIQSKLVSNMSLIQKVVFDIEVINKSLTTSNDRFQVLLNRLVFLCNYKVALEEELKERKRKFNDILLWREKERAIQKQRGYPIPEPVYSRINLMGCSCFWDPWLCTYIPNNPDDDLDLCIPSELNVDYDQKHENWTTDQLLDKLFNNDNENNL